MVPVPCVSTAPVPPPAYHRAQAQVGRALRIDAVTLVTRLHLLALCRLAVWHRSAPGSSEGGEPMVAVLAPFYPWVVFAHVANVFGFLLAHGVSVGVLFKLRGEHKLERIRALLDLSKASIAWTYAFLVLIGVTGFAAVYIGDWWRHVWVWASAALLILIALAMDWIGDPYFDRLRVAIGLEETKSMKGAPALHGPLPDIPAGEEELVRLLSSPHPLLLALVGIVGLAAILWLMILKPL